MPLAIFLCPKVLQCDSFILAIIMSGLAVQAIYGCLTITVRLVGSWSSISMNHCRSPWWGTGHRHHKYIQVRYHNHKDSDRTKYETRNRNMETM